MFLYIYKITNLVNGKIYIGKHSSIKLGDTYMGSGILINRAIKKYKIENFTKDVLCICETEKKLNEKEMYFIKKTGAFGCGYNLTKGGEGKLGYKPSIESRDKSSKSLCMYYKNNPQERKKLSKLAKKRIGSLNPFYNKKLTKEHIQKMTVARVKAISGSKNPSAVRVLCVEINKKFDTAKEAAVYCGLKYSTTILKAAKGQRKKAGGYTWKII